VRAVGADLETPVDVRVIAATHRDLQRAVADGTFRADLLARLSQVSIRLPALRERKQQLLTLARSFAAQEGGELTLEVDAAEALLLWSWPFNLRELQSLVRELLVMRGTRALLDLAYLAETHPHLAAPLVARAAGTAAEGDSTLEERSSKPPQLSPTLGQPRHDRLRLRALLEQHAGNVSQVAKELGKPRSQIYRWMEALGLSVEQFRDP
jgi:transcriptional regulator of acetoin/glycerol metabolism